MIIRDVMTRNIQMAQPDQTVAEIARTMAEKDIGFMPVGENDRLVGMITDRDIVVRALARGQDGQCRVRDVMTPDIKYCFEDEDIDHVVMAMGDQQLRRMPVLNRDKRLVGVLSLADVAQGHDAESTGIAFGGITGPGGLHSQSSRG
jgi:CBS domain-containing protein